MRITTSGLGDMFGLPLYNGTVYFLAYGEPSLLSSIPVGGGTWSNSYDSVGGTNNYGNPAVDSRGNIYYLDYSRSNSQLMMLPAGATTSQPVTLSGSPTFYELTAGPVFYNRSLYVLNYDQSTSSTSIIKIALTYTPDAPSNVTATAGNGSAKVSWTGSRGATSYTATAHPGGATCTATAPATSCSVTGLTNGKAYTFTVTASNAAGSSSASHASSSVTPNSATTTTGTGPSPLPNTGAPIAALLIVGLGALGLGTTLVVRRRRFRS